MGGANFITSICLLPGNFSSRVDCFFSYLSDPGYKKLTAGGGAAAVVGDDLMLAEEGGIQMKSFSSNKQPPSWVNDVDGIERCLADIRRQMDALRSMHASRVGSVFGKDLDDMEGRIERKTQDITDEFRHAERLLQKVGAATRRAGGEEATVGANIQRRYKLRCRVSSSL